MTLQKRAIVAICILMSHSVWSQTNTFPATGGVGIGTTSPVSGAALHVVNGVSVFSNLGGSNYDENIRLPASNVGWAAIALGATSGVSGSGTGQWTLIRNPDLKFVIRHSQTDLFTMQANGNVGIGTGSPSTLLDLASNNGGAFGFGDGVRIKFANGAAGDRPTVAFYRSRGAVNSPTQVTTNDVLGGCSFFGYTGSSWVPSGTIRFDAENSSGHGKMNIFTYGADGENVRLTILSNGRVGIGTLAPQAELAVKGTIYAKKVKVTQTGWSDFVFEKDYVLKPLSEVEAFIKQNKHLPEVPSADEVAKNDLDLGEMNKILLQKVEEHTLYLIAMQKENEQLMKENIQIRKESNNQKDIIESLSKRLEILETSFTD